MTQRPSPSSLTLLLAAFLVPLASACGDDATGPEADTSVRVTLERAGASPGPVNSASPSADGARQGPANQGNIVTLPDVQSIEVTVSGVRVLPAGAGGQDGGVSLSVVGGSRTVQLLSLPASGGGTPLASAEVEPGDYRNVRIFFSGASVTFTDSVTVRGAGGTADRAFAGGTPHEVTIPGGQESGLELVPEESFSVPGERGGQTVRLVADVTASVGTISVTDAGLVMNPVLSATTDTTEMDSGI